MILESNITVRSLQFANKVKIFYTDDLDGGGSTQYQDFVDYLKTLNKNYKVCLEWCSGLGAIGFAILDHDYCENLHLMDKYPPVLHVTKLNIAYNNLQDRVRVSICDNIAEFSHHEKIDLVVGNPPHRPFYDKEAEKEHPHYERLVVDKDWKIHQEFFSNITKHLATGADIIISSVDPFEDIKNTHIRFAHENNIDFVRWVEAPVLGVPHGKLWHYRYNG